MTNQSPRIKRKNEGIKGSVFTFFSTASAVGKTVLAVNYAADLAERGYKVCLADLDLQFGDVCNYLGITPEKTLFNYYEQEDGQRDTATCITEIKYGFDVLAAPLEVDEGFIMDAETIVQAINQLRDDYDYVLLDTTTGFTGITLAILEQTDVLYLPCVVDFIPSIKDLKIGLETLHKLQFDYQRVRLILNRNKAETQISIKDVETLLGRPFQYFISNDYQGIMQSIKEAKPVVLTESKNKLADEISEMVSEELGEKEESGGLTGWLGSLFK
ncbi:MAG: AAA family ATPase [Phascolarctobacterium sp.]|nr:AAA family ATPase [Phascolarctobacterium sp.]